MTLLMSRPACSQELLDLLGSYGSQLAGEEGARLKLRIDSIDFQFAMSVSENAGFFDPQVKGEAKAGFLADLRSASAKTTVEIARDSVEFGLGQYGIRRYKMAERSFLNAEKLLIQNGLEEHMVYLRAISCLGLIYLVQGRWQEAGKYIPLSLRESEGRVGKNSAPYIANLNNHAKLNQALGKFNEAEQEFNEARKLAESFFGGSMQTAILINNQAMLAQTLGRNEQAVALMNEALANAAKGRKKIIEGQSFDDRRFRMNLGIMLMAQGKPSEAEKVLLEVKKAADARRQTRSQEYGTLLNVLGTLYIQTGMDTRAEELLLQAEEVFRKRFNDVNYLSAKVFNDLGNFYRLRGRYKEAEQKLNRAMSIRETLFRPDHPDLVKTREDLALLFWKNGQADKAMPIYNDVMEKTISFIAGYFPPMSEAEKSKYWNTIGPRFQRYYNFSLDIREKDPSALTRFFEYHLLTKGLLLNATSKVRKAILAGNDRALQDEYHLWIDLREQLAEAYTYSKNKLKAQNISLEELEESANTIEKSLSGRSASFAETFSAEKVRAGQIASVLRDGEAVVDIVRVRSFSQDFSDDSRYVAFILKKGSLRPAVRILERGKELEGRHLKFYKNSIRARLSQPESYKVYWRDIDADLNDVKVIYVSLDGVYNEINLNTLMDESGTYLINRREIRVVGNARDLISKRAAVIAVFGEAALVGFPEYGRAFDALPGTRSEIESISQILRSKAYPVKLFTSADASEQKIKTLSNPLILHIASHGFFLPDASDALSSSLSADAEKLGKNPLLRSGLILAEASGEYTLPGDLSGQDNGFLTAYEVMNMNLDETELVVLSACETALGEVRAGEGVYGLQRSFLIAGSKFLVMSLWKVDDLATRELMVNFYNNWLSMKDIQKAFKSAALQLKEKFPDPYYWGAFVMVGNY